MPEKSPWSWDDVKAAAYEWLADNTEHASTLFVPVGTNEIIRSMCGDLYDVEVREWPVEKPTFGNGRPMGPACVDRSVEATMAVLQGEQNTRGLPFPLYSDLSQRDIQFQFMKQKQADDYARRLYQIADWTLRQLLIWSLVQHVSPSITRSQFKGYWEGLGMGGLGHDDLDYAQALFSKTMGAGGLKRQHQQSVGDLWIVTNLAPHKVVPDKVRKMLKPLFLTSDSDRQLAGKSFGPDDRIYYTQWNPAQKMEAVQRHRVPRLLIPKHQLSPTVDCECLLCKRGGFNESSWYDVNEEMTRSANATGRLSMADPLSQNIPSHRDWIMDMTPEEYRRHRSQILELMRYKTQEQMQALASPSEMRKILGMDP